MKKVILMAVALSAIISCAGIAACGGAGGNAADQVPGQVLPQIGGGGDWSDIPIYPGAKEAYKIQGNETYDGGVWTTIHGIYESAAGLDDVSRFYQEKMPANGWEQEEWISGASGLVIGSFSKNSGEATAVIGLTNADNKKTIITIDKKYLR